MFKRFLLVFFTLIIAIAGLLVAAKEPTTGANTISYDDPANLIASLGMAVVLFIPPLIMAFFTTTVVKVTSTIYQSFIALSFISLIPVGFFVPNSFLLISLATAGTVVSIVSTVVTLNAGLDK